MGQKINIQECVLSTKAKLSDSRCLEEELAYVSCRALESTGSWREAWRLSELDLQPAWVAPSDTRCLRQRAEVIQGYVNSLKLSLTDSLVKTVDPINNFLKS